MLLGTFLVQGLTFAFKTFYFVLFFQKSWARDRVCYKKTGWPVELSSHEATRPAVSVVQV